MPISFVFRNLAGYYRGSALNPINDYIKISNMFLEIGKDLTSIDARLSALEALQAGIITNANFKNNSINGAIIQEGTLPGSAIQNNSITGAQIITNSINGLTDANISTNANINPSKINLSQLSHTQIKDIGTNTHSQIDQQLTQIFADEGTTFGNQINPSLLSRITTNTSSISSLNSSLSSVSSFLGTGPLSTHAQIIANAVNELYADFQSVGASGTFISGPASPLANSIAKWGSSNTSLLSSAITIDNSNNILTPGNINFPSVGNNIGTSSVPLFNINTVQISGYPLSSVPSPGTIPISPSGNLDAWITNIQGDVSGSLANTTVIGIKSVPFDSTIPSDSNILIADGLDWSSRPLVSGDVSITSVVTPLSFFGASGPNALVKPGYISSDTSGNIYVLDNEAVMKKYSGNGNFIIASGVYSGFAQHLSTVGSRVYISLGPTSQQPKVAVYDTSFNGPLLLVGTFGQPGGANACTADPQGNIYVQTDSNTIYIYDSTGAFVRTLNLTGITLGDPIAISIGPDGSIYVTDASPGSTFRFNAAGVFLNEVVGLNNNPTGDTFEVAFDEAGNVYVASQNIFYNTGTSSIDKATPTGIPLGRTITIGNNAGLGGGFTTGIAVGTSGNIYTTDTLNNRVNVWQPAYSAVLKQKDRYTVEVSQDGNDSTVSGPFRTINGALTHMNYTSFMNNLGPTQHGIIRIHPGTYNEIIDLKTTDNSQYVDLVGIDRDSCIIVSSGIPGNNSTLKSTGINIIENLTIQYNGNVTNGAAVCASGATTTNTSYSDPFFGQKTFYDSTLVFNNCSIQSTQSCLSAGMAKFIGCEITSTASNSEIVIQNFSPGILLNCSVKWLGGSPSPGYMFKMNNMAGTTHGAIINSEITGKGGSGVHAWVDTGSSGGPGGGLVVQESIVQVDGAFTNYAKDDVWESSLFESTGSVRLPDNTLMGSICGCIYGCTIITGGAGITVSGLGNTNGGPGGIGGIVEIGDTEFIQTSTFPIVGVCNDVPIDNPSEVWNTSFTNYPGSAYSVGPGILLMNNIKSNSPVLATDVYSDPLNQNANGVYQYPYNLLPTSSGIQAAGTSAGTATQLTAQVNEVVFTSLTASGVILPIPQPGAHVVVVNKTNLALNVYPPNGQSINYLSQNLPALLPSGCVSTLYNTSLQQWYSTQQHLSP